MRWFIVAAAATLSACTYHTDHDEAILEQQRLEAKTNAVFASVEEHAGCAGFHHAYAELDAEKQSKAAFHTTAARNAKIAATKIAADEVQEDLAEEMVEEIAENHAAEWAYTIESGSQPNKLSAQADKCQTLAEKHKSVVRDIVKAKYGFKR